MSSLRLELPPKHKPAMKCLKNDTAQATYCENRQLWISLFCFFFCIIKICEFGKAKNTHDLKNAYDTKLYFGSILRSMSPQSLRKRTPTSVK